MGSLPYRPDIDGLRALAVLAVVGFHAFPRLVPGGFVGVDVFFVISGFLITSIIATGIEDGTFDMWAFYGRRIRRIFPALIAVSLVILALGHALLLPDEYENLGLHVFAGALFSANLLSWNESDYFATAAEDKPLLHLWSLGIEEQFYLLWPITLIAVWRLRKYRAACLAAIAVSSCLLGVLLVSRNPTAAFYSPLTRVWELMIGALLVLALRSRDSTAGWSPRARNAISLVGLMLIGVSIALFTRHTPFPGWRALAPTVGAALVIAAGPTAWANRRVLSFPVVVGIGLISYSLYLWHWPLLVISRLTVSQSPLLRVGMVALAIGLSWATYVMVERPCRSTRSGRQTVVGLAATLTILACLGIGVYASGGLAGRYPEGIQAVAGFTFDPHAAYRMECSLPTRIPPSQFSYCVDPPSVAKRSSLFLWGDSHAEHLYPGIVKRFHDSAEITRLTASSCPPILGHPVQAGAPNCEAFNLYVVERVAKERPDRIIMAAGWKWYDWKLLAPTIARLRAAGAKRIDVVGPVPNWLPTLKRSLINNARFNPNGEFPAKRMLFGLDPRVPPLDRSMREFVSTLGVNYVSPWELWCTAEGCLTRVGAGITSLTAWDYAHLTSEGSESLVSMFPD